MNIVSFGGGTNSAALLIGLTACMDLRRNRPLIIRKPSMKSGF